VVLYHVQKSLSDSNEFISHSNTLILSDFNVILSSTSGLFLSDFPKKVLYGRLRGWQACSSEKVLEYLKCGHYWFLPRPFQFTNHPAILRYVMLAV
jgi:hypothetical protein